MIKETAVLKSCPEDFCVTEVLPFEPEGEGEHLLMYLSRENMTTAEVVRRIAKLASVQQRNVSFSGTKDKHAHVKQWFSLWLPGKDFDTALLKSAGLQLISANRHRKKLRRGTHKYNGFSLRLRNIVGDRSVIDTRLEAIKINGYANFFGPQRFGIKQSNLIRADHCDDIHTLGRQDRSFTLSAIRALLFNRILEERLSLDTRLQIQAGDIAMFTDGASRFLVDELTDDIRHRDSLQRIVPTGPLWGLGNSEATLSIANLENRVVSAYPKYQKLIEQAKMASDRRPLKVYPQDMSWHWLSQDSLQLNFVLPKSAYATSLVSHIVNTSEVVVE